MFTGIIEALGIVEDLKRVGSNLEIHIASPISSELEIDQSVSHNGVCLTVALPPGPLKKERPGNPSVVHFVVAVEETLTRSNLGKLKPGDVMNLECCMKADGRFDGHIVQGHVDCTAVCKSIADKNGSWEFRFTYDAQYKNLIVAKGSICINGVSLTVVDDLPGEFTVAIIPYTFEHTNFALLKVGSEVNIEFDVIGKYVAKMVGN